MNLFKRRPKTKQPTTPSPVEVDAIINTEVVAPPTKDELRPLVAAEVVRLARGGYSERSYDVLQQYARTGGRELSGEFSDWAATQELGSTANGKTLEAIINEGTRETGATTQLEATELWREIALVLGEQFPAIDPPAELSSVAADISECIEGHWGVVKKEIKDCPVDPNALGQHAYDAGLRAHSLLVRDLGQIAREQIPIAA